MKINFTIPLLVVFIIIASSNSTKAQDLHFSQFYNSPLTLNPALTGRMKEDYRAVLNYRNQWRQINSTYATSALSGDMNFKPGVTKLVDKIGVGLVVLNDELAAGANPGDGTGMFNGVYKNVSFIGSLAAHKTLDRRQRHKLSIGLQGGYVQTGLNASGLTFNNQVQNFQINSNAPSGASLRTTPYGYMDINAGAFWDFNINPKLDVYAGISFFNVNNPKEALYTAIQDKNKLPDRSVSTLGFSYKISERVAILPSFVYQRDAKAMDFIAGSAVGYKMLSTNAKKAFTLLGGLYYRMDDAAIAMIGAKFRNYQVGFSYDATTSSLNNVKNDPAIGQKATVNAFEISLIYLGFFKRAIPNQTSIPCRFF